MSKKLPFKPTKALAYFGKRKGEVLRADRRTREKKYDIWFPANALIVPLVPGHEWVLKPTAGKGRGKKAKESKRG